MHAGIGRAEGIWASAASAGQEIPWRVCRGPQFSATLSGQRTGRVPPSGVSPQVSKVEALGAQLITADSLSGRLLVSCCRPSSCT